jgi:hypothetical protein
MGCGVKKALAHFKGLVLYNLVVKKDDSLRWSASER